MNVSKNYLLDYEKALRNEIALDLRIYQIFSQDPANFGYLPRPSKWLSKNKERPTVIKSIGFFLRTLWLVGGARLFFHWQYHRILRFYKQNVYRLPEAIKESSYGIAFSSRAADILKTPALAIAPTAWIHFPWVETQLDIEASHNYSLLSLLEKSDFKEALRLSKHCVDKICHKNELKAWSLQSYTAFRWFLVRIALDKLLGGHFFIAEHYDRWAVLSDAMVVAMKEANIRPTSLTLMQHGILGSLKEISEDNDSIVQALPARLKGVDSIYVYDDHAAKIFRDEVLDSNSAKHVVINYFVPRIELRKVSQMNNIRLLFVGHPLCEELHRYLYKRLYEHKLDVFYKPHPTAKMSESARKLSWRIIDERNFFPEVDLLISYPSTLVTEYENVGIEALVHSIDLKIDNSAEFLRLILEKVRTMQLNK